MKTVQIYIDKEELSGFDSAINDCSLRYDLIKEDATDILVAVHYNFDMELFRLGRISMLNKMETYEL